MRNRTRLLSPESECTSSLTSCQTTLRLNISAYKEILRKYLKCLDLMASIQPATQKTNFDIYTRKLPYISCRTFRKKPILFNFMNLLTTLWQRLWVCKMLLHQRLVFSTNLKNLLCSHCLLTLVSLFSGYICRLKYWGTSNSFVTFETSALY